MALIKRTWLVSCTLLFMFPVFSQTGTVAKGFSIGMSVNVPVGEFSSTHMGGIGLEYAPSRHTFTFAKKDSAIMRSKIAFYYNGGIAYYLGKKETVSGYDYKYPAYLFLHAFAGLIYVPVPRTSFKLTAGPAMGIYNGNTRFNLGSKLEASYYISPVVAIGPGIILMKEFDVDAIWAAALKVSIDF